MTPYQIRLLSLASHGLSNKQIGIQVGGLSERTIKNHFTILYKQMKVENRTHAVAIALREGIIE